MQEQKRMYSKNKICYLLAAGFEPIAKCADELNGNVYYVFEDSEAVKDCIASFYKDQNIHAFIDALSRVSLEFRAVKQKMNPEDVSRAEMQEVHDELLGGICDLGLQEQLEEDRKKSIEQLLDEMKEMNKSLEKKINW